MPIYEYRCLDCEHEFERMQKFSDPPVEDCPSCMGKVQKLISRSTFHLKGDGWYVTDYARKSGADGSDTSSESKSTNGTKSTSDSKTESSSSSTSDSSSQSSTSSESKSNDSSSTSKTSTSTPAATTSSSSSSSSSS